MEKLKRGRKRIETTAEQDSQIIELHSKGLLKTEICKEMNLSYMIIGRAFDKLNLVKNERVMGYGATRNQIMKELQGNYRTCARIARKLGCSKQFVHQVLKDVNERYKTNEGIQQIKRTTEGLEFKCDQLWYCK